MHPRSVDLFIYLLIYFVNRPFYGNLVSVTVWLVEPSVIFSLLTSSVTRQSLSFVRWAEVMMAPRKELVTREGVAARQGGPRSLRADVEGGGLPQRRLQGDGDETVCWDVNSGALLVLLSPQLGSLGSRVANRFLLWSTDCSILLKLIFWRWTDLFCLLLSFNQAALLCGGPRGPCCSLSVWPASCSAKVYASILEHA